MLPKLVNYSKTHADAAPFEHELPLSGSFLKSGARMATRQKSMLHYLQAPNEFTALHQNPKKYFQLHTVTSIWSSTVIIWPTKICSRSCWSTTMEFDINTSSALRNMNRELNRVVVLTGNIIIRRRRLRGTNPIVNILVSLWLTLYSVLRTSLVCDCQPSCACLSVCMYVWHSVSLPVCNRRAVKEGKGSHPHLICGKRANKVHITFLDILSFLFATDAEVTASVMSTSQNIRNPEVVFKM